MLLKSPFPTVLFAVKQCKMLQSRRLVFLLTNQDGIVLNAFSQRKSMLAPKTLLQGLLDYTLALLQPFQTNDVFFLRLRIILK